MRGTFETSNKRRGGYAQPFAESTEHSPIWEYITQSLEGGRIERYVLTTGGTQTSYGDVMRLWQEDEPFRSFFISLLQQSSFPAYRWETPPVTLATIEQPFEFVLLNAPGLVRQPDRAAFAERFLSAAPGRTAVGFPNLGNDAFLVVPCPAGLDVTYVHLAEFVRHAPAEQVHELISLVAGSMKSRMGVQPVWLSTAGMGVAWLHVRIDARPKYYGYKRYCEDV